MKSLTLLIFLSLVAVSCSTPMVRTETHFANQLAEAGLWKEALYRWEKQFAENPDSPALLNNLAVAMEQAGNREKAEEFYRKALKLAPNNAMIQRNFNQFMNPDPGKTEDQDEKKQQPSRSKGAER